MSSTHRNIILQQAFERYQRVKDECSKSGDWTPYADLFVEEGSFIDHHGMGLFRDRAGILEYITKAMAPYPTMTFPIDWIAYDEVTSAIVFQVQNAFPAPPYRDAASKEPFAFPNWTRVAYDHKRGKFVSEETVYNPLKDAGKTVKGWRAAGGEFKSPEQLKYLHSKYPEKQRGNKL